MQQGVSYADTPCCYERGGLFIFFRLVALVQPGLGGRVVAQGAVVAVVPAVACFVAAVRAYCLVAVHDIPVHPWFVAEV